MPHLAVKRPLGEFYLADEPRNKPRRLVLVLHLLAEGLLASAQGLHFSIEGFQHRLVEAGADMPRVDPALLRFVAYGKCQGAEVLARPARLSVTDYHHLLLMYGLELEPLARSLARVIQPRRALGDHALFVRSLCPGELPYTELGDVLAVAQQRIARQESLSESSCVQAAVFCGCPCRPRTARRKQHRVTSLFC